MSSHIRDHIREQHPENLEGLLEVFQMRKSKSCFSALQRQIMETVEVTQENSHCLLNNKEEYNR